MGNTLADPEFAYPDQGSGPRRKPQATSAKKYLTKIINRGTIPYNLKERKNYGLFSTTYPSGYETKNDSVYLDRHTSTAGQ
jgi:hypothetical protein